MRARSAIGMSLGLGGLGLIAGQSLVSRPQPPELLSLTGFEECSCLPPPVVLVTPGCIYVGANGKCDAWSAVETETPAATASPTPTPEEIP